VCATEPCANEISTTPDPRNLTDPVCAQSDCTYAAARGPSQPDRRGRARRETMWDYGDDNRGPEMAAVALVMTSLSVIAVALRCYTMVAILKRFLVEDWLAVLTCVSNPPDPVPACSSTTQVLWSRRHVLTLESHYYSYFSAPSAPLCSLASPTGSEHTSSMSQRTNGLRPSSLSGQVRSLTSSSPPWSSLSSAFSCSACVSTTDGNASRFGSCWFSSACSTSCTSSSPCSSVSLCPSTGGDMPRMRPSPAPATVEPWPPSPHTLPCSWASQAI
jgi:hypothetical protein